MHIHSYTKANHQAERLLYLQQYCNPALSQLVWKLWIKNKAQINRNKQTEKKKNPCYEMWEVRQVRQVLPPHTNNFLAHPLTSILSLRDYFPNNTALIEW